MTTSLKASTLLKSSTVLKASTLLKAPVDRLLVKETEVERKTTGGIILTDKAGDPQNLARKGVVVSSGISEGELEVGTTVYFGKHCGATIQNDSEILISLVKADIVAVLLDE